MKRQGIKVLFVAAEAEPFIKVGGLADVAGTLPKALARLPEAGRSIDIRLCLPYYPKIQNDYPNLPKVSTFTIQTKTGDLHADAYSLRSESGVVYFIDGSPIAQDPAVYNLVTEAVGDKFLFFTRAALGLLKHIDFVPDIIHVNDWHTSLIPFLVRQEESTLPHVKTVLTLHNLPFMGAGIEASMDNFNIPRSADPMLPPWALRLPLPLGLSAVDRIIPVSPNYAREILETDAGCDLHSLLMAKKDEITGILNGLDTEGWNPATDPCILSRYSLSSIVKRGANKRNTLKDFKLSGNDIPLLTIVSRMDQQKGIDIAIESLRLIPDKRWHLIILGSGNPSLEKMGQDLADEFPERVRVVNSFDVNLSHKLYSSADMLLMPSRYEPCGLSQMIAMRYGCVPVASDVGGLHDTIVDFRRADGGTGFLSEGLSSEHFSSTIKDALSLYKDKDRWARLITNAMKQDFSWNRSAKKYYDIYTQLVS